MKQQSSRTLPIPANFPVRWPKPEDARMFWEIDRMHYPAPMRPLEYELMRLYVVGFNRAAEHYHMPVRMAAIHINTYYYQTIYPIAAPPEPVLRMMNGIGKFAPGFANSIQKKAVDALAKKYLEQLNPVLANLGEIWEKDWLPAVKEHLAFWTRFDLEGATMADLVKHFDESMDRAFDVGDIHFRVGIAQLLAVSRFADVYTDLFPGAHSLDAYRLVQGFANKTLETDRALWRLSIDAMELPAVRETILELPADQVVAALDALDEAAGFMAAFRAFLDEYGQRGDRFATIGSMSWIEDPTPVIKNLKDYLLRPVPDPDEQRASLAGDREVAVDEARKTIARYPKPVVEEFEAALKAAQVGNVLQEDHGFWIDFRCLYRLRRVLLEFGRRFAAAGVCDRAEDALFLTSDELRETAMKLPAIDRHSLVAERRASFEHFSAMQAPPSIGRLPLMGPPDDPIGRVIGRFFGPPVTAQADTRNLRGVPGSLGTYRGTARIVRSLAEASKLGPGDVLVTETTAAPWTPLFATAGAVVTDTGGALCHCALVAREYRIPAVVGTGTATALIPDGALVEVDGTNGCVRLL